MEIKKYFLIFLIILFSACSSNRDNDKIEQLIKLYFKQFEENRIVKITHDKIKNVNYPIIEIRTNGLLKQSTFLPMTSRNEYTNWTSGIGHNITMQGGIITKTNGMNTYLNSLEIQEFNPFNNNTKLDNWPKEITKKYKFLLPNYLEKNIVVKCELKTLNKEKITLLERSYNFNKVEEICENKKFNFKNIYWVNSRGFIWKSKQLISINKIFADISVLKR